MLLRSLASSDVLATLLLPASGVLGQERGAGNTRPPALLQDYIAFPVTAPPPELGLDPFYRKYVDAHRTCGRS